MRIPARILEHPVEAVLAGILLLGLLFGSAEMPAKADKAALMVSSEKM